MTDPSPVDLGEDDHLIAPSDNSGELGQPLEDQDPTHVPAGDVQ